MSAAIGAKEEDRFGPAFNEHSTRWTRSFPRTGGALSAGGRL